MATRRIRVGVIFGGRSGEHDVSLRSAHAIMNAMDQERFEPVPIGITREGNWITGGNPLKSLASSSGLPLPESSNGDGAPDFAESEEHALVLDSSDSSWVRDLDVVFPVLHGPYGEDGTVQGLLELAGIPYVGPGVLSSAVAMDKITAKRLFSEAGLPVGTWIGIRRRDWERNPAAIYERVQREIGYPCFVKPSNMGSSVGVEKARSSDELPDAIAAAAAFDRRLVIERGIDARELEVSVLGNDDPISSVVGEVVPGHEYYDYEAKYVDDSSTLLIPAPIDNKLADQVRSISIEAYRLIDGAGLSRIDFFLERGTDRIVLNEINTIPGFTAISMYPRLWEASGLSFSELVSRLIDLATERHDQKMGNG